MHGGYHATILIPQMLLIKPEIYSRPIRTIDALSKAALGWHSCN
jgi:hypothetical protein